MHAVVATPAIRRSAQARAPHARPGPPRRDAIITFSGGLFWPFDPRPQHVRLTDVAHALSMLCRFTGHVRRFYSVAEHSVRVSLRAEALCTFGPARARMVARWGLMHDADEAYLLDLARPVKYRPELEAYRRVGRQVQLAVCERFGLPSDEPDEVRVADRDLFTLEVRSLFPSGTERLLPRPAPVRPSRIHPVMRDVPRPTRLRPWSPEVAERRFLARFRQLWGAA